MAIIGISLLTMTRYKFMIRLIRVQVQLMSEKEYTKIIIAKIRRSKMFEWILMVLMTIIITCYVGYYLPDSLIN